MGEVVNFPSPTERDWRLWEEAIRSGSHKAGMGADVIEAALPAIKEHWRVIFEAVTVEAPSQAVPGPLTAAQGKAIQKIIDASAQAVIERLKHERHVALGRLIQAELALSFARSHGSA